MVEMKCLIHTFQASLFISIGQFIPCKGDNSIGFFVCVCVPSSTVQVFCTFNK